MPANPFDWTGGPFLALYVALFGVALALSHVLGTWARAEGRAEPIDDELALACLAGGRARVVETVAADLLQQGALEIRRTRLVATEDGEGRSTVQRALLKAADNVRWPAVHGRMRSVTRVIEKKLVENGLHLSDSEALRVRWMQALPLALLLVFGAIKWQVGVDRERPVGFLTVLMIVTLIIAFVRFGSIDRRTRAGRAVLRAARADKERLRRAPVENETGLAVALFGTTVLAASPLSDFDTLCRRNPSTGGSSDNSSGCSTGSDGGGDSGSGGCGGGGCGGCGG
jgi:uncharacterized protein (TIGR04222 family)